MEGQPSELSKSQWAKRLRSEGRTGRPSYYEGAVRDQSVSRMPDTRAGTLFVLPYVDGEDTPLGRQTKWHPAHLTSGASVEPLSGKLSWTATWNEAEATPVAKKLGVSDLLAGSLPFLNTRGGNRHMDEARLWNVLMKEETMDAFRKCWNGGYYGNNESPLQLIANLRAINFNAHASGLEVMNTESILASMAKFCPDMSRLCQRGLDLSGHEDIASKSLHEWPQLPRDLYGAGYFEPLVPTVGVETFTISPPHLRGRSESLLGQLGVRATKNFERGDIIGFPGGEMFLATSDMLDPSTAASHLELNATLPDGTRILLVLDPYKGYTDADDQYNILLRRMNDSSKNLGGPNSMKGAFQQNCAFVILEICGWPFLLLMATRSISVGDELTGDYGKRYRPSQSAKRA